MSGFQPTAPQRNLTLTADAFTPGSQLLGIMSPIAYYDVPLGHILGLYGKKPFRAYIKGKTQIVIDTATTPARVIHSNGSSRLVRTQRPATFPTKSHPDVLIYGQFHDNPEGWQPMTLTSIDFETGDIWIQEQGHYDLRIYYVLPDGEFEIRAARPVGSDGVTSKLFGAPFRALHEVDQTNARSAPQFGSRDIYSLPQNYRITIEARTNAVVEWSADAGHELVITAADQPVRITDEQALMVRAEEKLRGGF